MLRDKANVLETSVYGKKVQAMERLSRSHCKQFVDGWLFWYNPNDVLITENLFWRYLQMKLR
jgi:hypothetical protein